MSVVIRRFITSEDARWNIRNIKLKSFFCQKCVYISSLFITAVCFLFLLKLSDQKTKVSSICVLKADCKYSRETQHHINATTLSCDKQNITLWH